MRILYNVFWSYLLPLSQFLPGPFSILYQPSLATRMFIRSLLLPRFWYGWTGGRKTVWVRGCRWQDSSLEGGGEHKSPPSPQLCWKLMAVGNGSKLSLSMWPWWTGHLHGIWAAQTTLDGFLKVLFVFRYQNVQWVVPVISDPTTKWTEMCFYKALGNATLSWALNYFLVMDYCLVI